jgi:hypothetical protein
LVGEDDEPFLPPTEKMNFTCLIYFGKQGFVVTRQRMCWIRMGSKKDSRHICSEHHFLPVFFSKISLRWDLVEPCTCHLPMVKADDPDMPGANSRKSFEITMYRRRRPCRAAMRLCFSELRFFVQLFLLLSDSSPRIFRSLSWIVERSQCAAK